jgi:hypothetical protein
MRENLFIDFTSFVALVVKYSHYTVVQLVDTQYSTVLLQYS